MYLHGCSCTGTSGLQEGKLRRCTCDAFGLWYGREMLLLLSYRLCSIATREVASPGFAERSRKRAWPGRRPGPGQRDELGGGRQKLEFAGVARSAIIAAPAASQRVTDRRTCPLDDGWLRGLPPVCPNAGHRYPGWPPPRLSRQRFRLMVLAFLIILPK